MRKLSFNHLFLLLFAIGCSVSNVQTIEKSGSKPAWVSGAENNFIITSGTGKDAEEAKNECIKNIRDNIINSIAVNVRSKTEINIVQQNGRSDEKMKFTVVSQAANIPYLNGISISKAKDFYWEKVKDKKTGQITVGYHIKYPFSNAELQKLIDEFEAQQVEIDKQIKGLTKALDTLSRLDVYNVVLDQLNTLNSKLIDDRKEKVEALLMQAKNQLKNLQTETISTSSESFVFRFKSNSRSIKSSILPTAKSNCAKNIKIVPTDTAIYVGFEGNLCKYTDNPSLQLNYVLAGETYTYLFPLDPNANKVELSIQSEVLWKKLNETDKEITEMEVELPLSSRYNYGFEINRIEFSVPNNQPVVIDNIKQLVNKKGVNVLKYKLLNPINKSNYSTKNKPFPYTDVTLFFTNASTGQKQSLVISNTKYSTNW